MIRDPLRNANRHRSRWAFLALTVLLAIFIAAPQIPRDEPFMPASRDYGFAAFEDCPGAYDLDQKKILAKSRTRSHLRRRHHQNRFRLRRPHHPERNPSTTAANSKPPPTN